MSTDPTEFTESDLDALMQALTTVSGEFPEAALRLAQSHRNAVIPRLIGILESATAQSASGLEVPGNAHLFAFFLLAEFRAREAWPALRKLLALTDERIYDLFGDLITEYLDAVLAVLLDESLDELDALLFDRTVDEYVRWGGLSAYELLIRDGKLTREAAVKRLHPLLKQTLVEHDTPFLSFLVSHLVHYASPDLEPDLRSAFRTGLIDSTITRERHLDESMAAGEAGFQKVLDQCRPSGVADTVELLRPWFTDDEESDLHDEDAADDPFYRDIQEDPDELETHPDTFRHSGPFVGRNDPCPCGSGRKFKKCCGKS